MLEMSFTTHKHWTAHTFVIKDRKLLAMEKFGHTLQNGTIVFVPLFKKKKNLQKAWSTMYYHDYSSMCGFFFFSSAIQKPLLVSIVEQREEDTVKSLSPFLLAESWRNLP